MTSSGSRPVALLVTARARAPGAGASVAAAVVHYRLLADPLYRSVCDINDTWSCTQVYESPYGAFWGVPVAVGGVVWFAAVTLLASWPLRGAGTADRPGRCRPCAGYIFALSVSGCRSCSISAYASLFVLKTYCLFCFITYFAVAGTVPGLGRRGGRNHDSTASAARSAICARL